MVKKAFIFLEFTLYRFTCNMIIEFLVKSQSRQNLEAAKLLHECNTSPGVVQLDYVIPTKSPMIGTIVYQMTKKPRGKCLIVNNLIKFIDGTDNIDETAVGSLWRESERFKYVFEQLYFEVELIFNINTRDMKNKLIGTSQDPTLSKSDAFIFMIITHGEKENILGYDACQGSDGNDFMRVKDVVDLFSEDKCPNLRAKPKLFFFTCCRISIKRNINKVRQGSSRAN
jgi:hypothetical protein